MDDIAFLSLRVPAETKRFIKQIAARKGTSVQDLIGGLVDDFIERENRAKPSLAHAVNHLRAAKAGLRELGVASKFASLGKQLENILGYEVDLAESRMLRPEIKREFQRDAVRVF